MEKNIRRPESDWRALAIYQVMVGSFAHSAKGAEGYDDMWGPEGERKDGNLRGVISALDHIARLGVTAIWLTPIFDSSRAEGGEKLRSTGYFANDYFSIDPHFGTEDDRERRLLDYVCGVMTFRRDNPAMWRGSMEFDRYRKDDAEILVVVKTDAETGNRVAMIFSDRDAEVALPGEETLHRVRGFIPELIRLG